MKTSIAASAFALMTSPAFAQDVKTTLPDAVGQVSPALEAYATDTIFGSEWTNEALSMRDRALLTFAALVTRHETENLGSYVALALDAGVTPAELSETITHLAFYSGWPTAMTGATIFKEVMDKREGKA